MNQDKRSERIDIFLKVRELPYTLFSPDSVEKVEKKWQWNCQFKNALLAHLLKEKWYSTRKVLARYKLRSFPEEVKYIPEGIDYHHAIQVLIWWIWIFLDATYDSQLEKHWFLVFDWDGESSTGLCEEPIDIKIECIDNPNFDVLYEEFLVNLDIVITHHKTDLENYRTKFETFIQSCRK
jgi:hypothetical protein